MFMVSILVNLVLSLSLAGSVYAQTSNYEILKVIDGDTVKILYPTLPPNLNKISIRVYGVDTPEKGFRAQCKEEAELGEKATKFTKTAIAKANNIEFELIKWDKYGGRSLGNIYIDGKSLSDMLIKEGYARPYFGKKKESWCPASVESTRVDKKSMQAKYDDIMDTFLQLYP